MLSLRQGFRELVRLVGHDPARRRRIDLYQGSQVRAIQLLKQNLSPAQRKQFERCRYFDVIGGDTGRHYRIREGCQMNVEQLDKSGRRVRILCFMPEGHLAVGDVLLAQKLALELFESETLKVAHKAPALEFFLDRENPGRRQFR